MSRRPTATEHGDAYRDRNGDGRARAVGHRDPLDECGGSVSI
jgi:hypothetical protein